MLVIALTGGIGSGKSTVSKIFEHKNIPVIDTDVISREIVEPEKPAYTEILNLFGSQALDSTQNINRNYLRDIIFSDPAKKQQLENILHPIIWKEVLSQINSFESSGNIPYCIVVVPLLFETSDSYKNIIKFDRSLVIDVPESVQIQRVMLRDNGNKEIVEAIMKNQVSRKIRLDLADDIIANTDNLKALENAVEKIHQYYIKLANK